MPADFSVRTVIKAVDKVTRPVRRMSRALGGMMTRALRRVGRAARSAAIGLGRMAAKGALLGGTAALAVTGGILKMVDATQKQLDVMGKFVRRSGISVTAYQELRHAADLAGVSNEAFDKSLEKFTRNLGDAKAGIGTLQAILKKNAPVFLEQLKNTDSVGDAFELMVAAMGEIKDPAERASLAAAAFGRSGAAMTLMLEGGTEQLRRHRKEAHELGLVMGTDATKAAEDYVDATTRLKGAIKGVVLQMSIGLGPWLTKTADRMRRYVVANRALIAQKLETVFRKLVEVFKALGKWIASVDWSQVIEDVRSFVTWISDGIKAVGGFKNVLIGLGVYLAGGFLLKIGAAIGGLAKLTGALGAAGKVGAAGKLAGAAWGGAFALAATGAIAAGLIIRQGLKDSEQRRKERGAQKRRVEDSADLDALALGGGTTKRAQFGPDGKLIADRSAQFRGEAIGRFQNEGKDALAAQETVAARAAQKASAGTLALLGIGDAPRPTLIPRVGQLATATGPTQIGGSAIRGGTIATPGKAEVVVRFVDAPAGTRATVAKESGAVKTRTKVGTRGTGTGAP